jgi:hypothetical protein
MEPTLKTKQGIVPVSQVDLNTLNWYATESRSRTGKEVAAAELRRRNGGEQQQPRQQQAMVKPTSSLIGSFADPKEITAHLQDAAQHYHLVTPSPVCGRLPVGCEVVMSLVQIDPSDPHLYGVGRGKVCPDKTHLITILNAIGGSMEWSRRLDDRSHPHLCEAAVGIIYRAFDGSLIRRSGRAEMDAREPDGPRYVEAVEQAKAKGRAPAQQLLQLRKFLWRHTESRALLAAIANVGIRRSYKPEELRKPFACASLMFTGHSDDPEARREFRQGIMQAFLGGSQSLYGPPAQAAPQLGTSPPFESSSFESGSYGEPEDYETIVPRQAPPAQQEPTPAAAQQTIGDGYDDRGDNPDAY